MADQVASFRELFAQGHFEEAATLFASQIDRDAASHEDLDDAAWSFIMWGNLLWEPARQASGDEAARLFAAAGEKYRAVLAIKPDFALAWLNWGNLLFEQAKRAGDDETTRCLRRPARSIGRPGTVSRTSTNRYTTGAPRCWSNPGEPATARRQGCWQRQAKNSRPQYTWIRARHPIRPTIWRASLRVWGTKTKAVTIWKSPSDIGPCQVLRILQPIPISIS